MTLKFLKAYPIFNSGFTLETFAYLAVRVLLFLWKIYFSFMLEVHETCAHLPHADTTNTLIIPHTTVILIVSTIYFCMYNQIAISGQSWFFPEELN